MSELSPNELHPDLWPIQYLPGFPLDLAPTVLVNFSRSLKGSTAPSDITVQDLVVPGLKPSDPSVNLRLYSPSNAGDRALPAMLWFHGGGYVLGSHRMGADITFEQCRKLGIRVVSVEYRMGPDNPAPAGNDDAYAAWVYVQKNAQKLGVEREKVVVGGQSAGGGMAAALCQRIYDQGDVQPLSQYLLYPMLDDRTVLRPDSTRYIWTTRNNHYGWKSYLGQEPGQATVRSPYAVPGRREDLAGLPPAYITVGTIDLFHDENKEYAKKLEKAGVKTRFETVPGGFHAFETMPWFKNTTVGASYSRTQLAALASAFKGFRED
jgi:acetyl esterase/lipase